MTPQNTYLLATGEGDPADRLRMVDEVYGASTRQTARLCGHNKIAPGLRSRETCNFANISARGDRVICFCM
jgi:hypothetical protein